MIKWVLECPNCGNQTTRKTSGSIYPKDFDKESPKDVECYYCETVMKAIDAFDSSTYIGCCLNKPNKNLHTLKRSVSC